jgi:hypothetical protein
MAGGDVDLDSTEYQFTEKQVKKMLDRAPSNAHLHRWISAGNSTLGIKLNWVRSLPQRYAQL